MIWILNL